MRASNPSALCHCADITRLQDPVETEIMERQEASGGGLQMKERKRGRNRVVGVTDVFSVK